MNNCKEDFPYHIIFHVKFYINKVRLDFHKHLSINLYFLYPFFIELEALVKCRRYYPILMKSWSSK